MAKDQNAIDRSDSSSKFHPANLLLPENRGLLLDIVVFVVNLLLMRFLLGRFVGIIRSAAAGDFVAESAMFLFVVGLFVLPPLGATLKRWRFHERRQARGKDNTSSDSFMSGCLFNPITYLCLTIVLYAVINAFALQYFYGDNDQDHPGVFVGSILFGLVISVVNTYLVYRFFDRPKKEPSLNFLKGPRAEALGDLCIFTNMICYQLVWNLLGLGGFSRPGSFSEFVGRFGVFLFIALLVYFPPRIFYLADDIGKRRTWITILIANLPLIFKVLIGTSNNANW